MSAVSFVVWAALQLLGAVPVDSGTFQDTASAVYETRGSQRFEQSVNEINALQISA